MSNRYWLRNLALNVVLEALGAQSQTPVPQLVSSTPELGELPTIARLRAKDGSVTLILGMRESGKSVMAYRLAHLLGRPTYAVSPEETPPKWASELELEELAQEPPPWSTLVMDDLPAYMSSRDYTDAYVKVVEQLIPVVRHRRKLHLIFSSQSSGLSDKWCMDADVILMKPLSFLYADLERAAVKKLADKLMPLFNEMSEEQQLRHCYVFSRQFIGMCRVEKD